MNWPVTSMEWSNINNETIVGSGRQIYHGNLPLDEQNSDSSISVVQPRLFHFPVKSFIIANLSKSGNKEKITMQ